MSRLKLGDEVILTPFLLRRMRQAHEHSGRAFPSKHYLDRAESILRNGEIGEVTCTYEPNYEVTVKWPSGTLHMRDTWVMSLPKETRKAS